MQRRRKVTCGCISLLLLAIIIAGGLYAGYVIGYFINPLSFIKKVDQVEVSYTDLSADDKTTVDSMQTYLYNEFMPGACFGMPTIALDSIGGITIPKPDPIKRIRLVSRDDDGHYIFSFSDGRCCTTTKYEIEIWQNNDGFEYSVLKKQSSNSPC